MTPQFAPVMSVAATPVGLLRRVLLPALALTATVGLKGAGGVFPAREWAECPPEAQGIDSARLRDALDYFAANSGRDRNRELVIVRNGWLVARGDNVDHVHGIWSCTKSVTSTMLGLLVADGKCTPDTPAAELLPELRENYPGVTLRHFATMTSGYKARGDDAVSGHGQSRTPLEPAEPIFAPGAKFLYWDSAMNKFAEALTVCAGGPLESLFKRRIADAIGMNPQQWRWGTRGERGGMRINGGAGNGNGHLFISAREFARFGLLFLNEGKWNGRQLVDTAWIREATRAHVGSYGYNWWTNAEINGRRKWPGAPAGTYAALGHNNNHLFVIPEWNVVVVRLGLDQRDVDISDESWSEFFRRFGQALTGTVARPPERTGGALVLPRPPETEPTPATKKATAAPPAPVVLPARTIRVGQGGADGFVTVDRAGALHVVYGGKYRTGPAPDRLGREEAITDITPFHGTRVAVDGRGRPHVVFTAGATENAKQTYYTTRVDGRWIPAEKYADAADFRDRSRAYVADVAVDDEGNALASFWVSRPIARRHEYEDWSFYYRWRTPDGRWSEPRSLPAHWSSAPKVEYLRDRGFFLLYQYRGPDWRIAGPVTVGGSFRHEQSIPTGSMTLGNQVQNEGADFSLHPGGRVVIAGNRREAFDGPAGIWAATGTMEQLEPPVYLGGFPGTKRGSESGLHPVTAFDAETGHAFVCVLDRITQRGVFTIHRPQGGWVRSYTPLLPDAPAPQGTLRQGPSLADVPGPGVIALVRDGGQNWHLRHLLPGDAAGRSP